jgi:exosortase
MRSGLFGSVEWQVDAWNTRIGVAVIPFATGVTLVAYLQFFKRLLHEAASNPYAAHVVLVPVLACVLLWIQRRELWRLTPCEGTRSAAVIGMALVVAALVVTTIGYRTANVSLQALSFVGATAGLALWAYGAEGIRRIAFVLAFLLLMVPPPRNAVVALSPTIQYFVATFSGATLRLFGIPVAQDGIFLALPGLTLKIAEECSGLRFLPILFVFVTAFARLTLPTFSAQAVLMALSVPVAIMANLTRVIVTGAGAYFSGPDIASGLFHYYIGKACWLGALLVMILLAWALRRRSVGSVAGQQLASTPLSAP